MAGNSELSIISGPPLDEEAGIGALTLGGLLREATTRFSGNEAIVFHGDGAEVRWSYADLWERSLEVARALHATGLGKGERVGILMTNRPEFLSSLFGVALAGGVGTPLSTFSTPAELEYLLANSAVSVLLVERSVLNKDFVAILEEIEPKIVAGEPGAIGSTQFPYLRHVVQFADGAGRGAVEGWSDFLARGDAVAPELIEATAAAVTPADPGVLFFSSGSTGRPKGILSMHRGPCLQLWRWAELYRIGSERTRVWSANGFFWSGSLAQACGASLPVGGCLVLQKTFQPEEALKLMEAERVNFPIAWPHQWPQLEAVPGYEDYDLSAMLYADKTMPLAKHPSVNCDWREPHAAFGNTETFTINSIYPANTPDEEIAGSSGKPLPGNRFKIIAPLTGEVVPIGERGEIAVKGPTLMLGYIGVPADETLDDEGYLRTGDGGYVDTEGRLYWEGRLNDIIKTGGANVSPAEVDLVIRECAGVKINQTVGIPHDTLGEIVVTCIVPHEGVALDEAGVRAFAKDKLASYKTPRRVLFFREDEIELTGSAKIKTADLRQIVGKRLEAEGVS